MPIVIFASIVFLVIIFAPLMDELSGMLWELIKSTEFITVVSLVLLCFVIGAVVYHPSGNKFSIEEKPQFTEAEIRKYVIQRDKPLGKSDAEIEEYTTRFIKDLRENKQIK